MQQIRNGYSVNALKSIVDTVAMQALLPQMINVIRAFTMKGMPSEE